MPAQFSSPTTTVATSMFSPISFINQIPLAQQKQIPPSKGPPKVDWHEFTGAGFSVQHMMMKQDPGLDTSASRHVSQLGKAKKRGRRTVNLDPSTNLYNCDKCTKSFAHISNLHRHVRAIHLKQRPFKCTTCLKVFSHSSNKKRHELSCRPDFHPVLIPSDRDTSVSCSTATQSQVAP